MILHCSPAEGWRLAEPSNFWAFKVVLDGVGPDAAPPLAGLSFAPDCAHAWVEPDLPGRLAGPAVDAAWTAGYAAMLGVAARHGWVREDGAVRAHVERTG